MHDRPSQPQTPQSIRVALRAWKQLVVYELLLALLSGILLGPIGLAITYHLIALAGDGALGNGELLQFALSPLGIAVVVLGGSWLLALLFIEYSGLIVLADAALRGRDLTMREVGAKTLRARLPLTLIAIVQTCIAILVLLPFVAIGALTYWLLLSDADINYYIELRPPRFWFAVGIGVVLAAGAFVALVWCIGRWALSVPACALDGLGWRESLRRSSTIMRGRAVRLLAILGGWLLLKHVVLLAAIAGLDASNRLLTAQFTDNLSVLVWSTLALLLLDATVLQLIGAFFTIGFALLVARQYEQVCRTSLSSIASRVVHRAEPPQPLQRTTRLALVAALFLAPAISVGSSLWLLRGFVDERQTQVCAHRAGSSAAPENSLAALRGAIAAGADYVEIDVQQTADGKVVLMHDRDLRRVTGDPRNLTDVTLDDLEPLRLRDRNGPSDERIPTLAEFIDACGDRLRVNVELKTFGDSRALALAVLEVLQQKDFIDRAVVTCFDLPPLRTIQEADAELPVGIILAAVQGDMTRLPVDILSLNERLVTGGVIRRAHARGMEVFAWTVNDRGRALRLLDLGCDSILTSDPVAMRAIVDEYYQLSDTERMLLRIRRWMRE